MSRERAFATCIEMMEQRDYEITDIDEEQLRLTACKPDGNQVIVLFNSTPKFDAKSLKEIISIMNTMDVNHSIVLYEDSITSKIKNILPIFEDMIFELFAIEDLQYNITKHRLQPKFERLSVEDAEKFRKVNGTKFGVLRVDNAVSKFYNYQKADVIRIIRNGGYITYRIVK